MGRRRGRLRSRTRDPRPSTCRRKVLHRGERGRPWPQTPPEAFPAAVTPGSGFELRLLCPPRCLASGRSAPARALSPCPPVRGEGPGMGFKRAAAARVPGDLRALSRRLWGAYCVPSRRWAASCPRAWPQRSPSAQLLRTASRVTPAPRLAKPLHPAPARAGLVPVFAASRLRGTARSPPKPRVSPPASLPAIVPGGRGGGSGQQALPGGWGRRLPVFVPQGRGQLPTAPAGALPPSPALRQFSPRQSCGDEAAVPSPQPAHLELPGWGPGRGDSRF